MDKSIQRVLLRAIRAQVSQAYQTRCSEVICKTIASLPCYQQAKHLALYRSGRKEVDLDLLWHDACQAGKLCYFPQVLPHGMLQFLPASPSSPFVMNRFGILEPTAISATPMQSADLFLLPLLGFDLARGRLGTGQGYYDRFLATQSHPYCVGVGYAFQQCESFDKCATDYPLDLVVTEQAVISFSTESS